MNLINVRLPGSWWATADKVVISGAYDVVVAGGVEVMSRVPLGATRQSGFPYGPAVLARYDNFEFSQGEGAELIAERWGFSRQHLDEYSSRSHELAAAAIDAGAIDEQIVPVTVKEAEGNGTHEFKVDEGLRRGTTPEKLALVICGRSSAPVLRALEVGETAG